MNAACKCIVLTALLFTYERNKKSLSAFQYNQEMLLSVAKDLIGRANNDFLKLAEKAGTFNRPLDLDGTTVSLVLFAADQAVEGSVG